MQSLACTEGRPWGGPGRPGGGLGKLGEAVQRGAGKENLEEGTEEAYRGSGFDAPLGHALAYVQHEEASCSSSSLYIDGSVKL